MTPEFCGINNNRMDELVLRSLVRTSAKQGWPANAPGADYNQVE
jgi:hypothetical protein